ncbi:sugar lactone lactonase YvrE [Streptacidiphilus sp. MAP12-16]|uniref:SMP-30/gluconolactonase/LRE family protein n=1 Tax=Streptacidiphilus sp. MAP12-16 TaxID=3156300 RepID=UPI00351840F2
MARTPLRPVRWSPPPDADPVRRRTAVRTLPPVTLLTIPGEGPEHVTVDAEGRIITGLADGRILRISADGGRVETLADTGGRPLGIELYGDDALLVCDATRGLLRLDLGDGSTDVLCDSVQGEPLVLCSNAAVAGDGTIYFTQSSRRFGFDDYKGDLMEHSGTGRLLRCRDGKVDVVADGFQFANGVVLAPDEASVIVAETGAYRLTRLWVSGERVGTSEPFAEVPSGFPDNLTVSADGLVWVAMASPRDALLDRLQPRHPMYRKAIWALPARLQPGPKDIAWVIAFDAAGHAVHDLHGWGVGYRAVTSAREHAGRLYLGSLTERAVAVVDLDRLRSR